MIIKSLTVKHCDNAWPKEKPWKLSDGRGLYLEVMPSGSKLWRIKYNYGGKEKRYAFGSYPSTSLSQARAVREEIKQKLQDNIDPSAEKQEQKRLATLNAKNTFEAVATEWHQRNYDTWDKRHAEDLIYRMRKDLFPAIGNVPISQLKAVDVVAALRKIEDRGAGEMARRALQMTGQVMRYAVQTGRASTNFTPDLKGCLKRYKKKHYASLDIDKLPELVKRIRKNEARLYKQTSIALQLMMLTFVRTSELINAKWEEVDLDNKIWIIPEHRMKMRQEHMVPLCSQVCELLADLKNISGKREHLFPSIPRPQKTMSNATLLRALEKLGYHKVMTGHGFRALAMGAIKEKLGYQHEVIDRQLAHLPKSKVDRAYDRSKFLPQRTKMMQDWGDYIDKIA